MKKEQTAESLGATDDENLLSALMGQGGCENETDVRQKLHLLSHLHFTEGEARWHWEKILLHRHNLSRSLGRDIGLSVALADYFVNITKKISHPKLMEIAEFNRTVRESLKDPLTGLFNRKYMHMVLRNERKRAKRYGHQFSILFMDIDHFKRINDQYGHLVGDSVLKEAAQLLIQGARGEDYVFRYAGEEFLVLMPQTAKEDAMCLAERLRRNVEKNVFSGVPEDQRVTISGGIASYPLDGQTVELLLYEADQCLYQAKNAGRNRMVSFKKEPDPMLQAQQSHPGEQTLFDLEELCVRN